MRWRRPWPCRPCRRTSSCGRRGTWKGRLPEVGALLTAGVLTYGKAKAVADALRLLSAGDAVAAEAMILPGLPSKTYGQVTKLAVQAAVTVDPESANHRRRTRRRTGAGCNWSGKSQARPGCQAATCPPARPWPLARTSAPGPRSTKSPGRSAMTCGGPVPRQRLPRPPQRHHLRRAYRLRRASRHLPGRRAASRRAAGRRAAGRRAQQADERQAGRPGAGGPCPGEGDCSCRECDGSCSPPPPDDDQPEDGDDDKHLVMPRTAARLATQDRAVVPAPAPHPAPAVVNRVAALVPASITALMQASAVRTTLKATAVRAGSVTAVRATTEATTVPAATEATAVQATTRRNAGRSDGSDGGPGDDSHSGRAISRGRSSQAVSRVPGRRQFPPRLPGTRRRTWWSPWRRCSAWLSVPARATASARSTRACAANSPSPPQAVHGVGCA